MSAPTRKATSGAGGLPDFPMLSRELERCGWKRAPAGPLEEGFLLQTRSAALHVTAALFESDRSESLLVADLGTLVLPGREELFPRFLDFSIETRLLLGAARVLTKAGFVLLLSSDRMDLYRLPDERREYCIETLRKFEDELLPALAAKARPRGEGGKTSIGGLEDADALGGWMRHWGRTIGAALEIGWEDCEKFLWKFILMLQLARKTNKSEILGGWGLSCEKLGRLWSLTYEPFHAQEDFARLLDEFDHSFSTRLFTGDAEMHKQWLGRLDETSLVEQWRSELLMQSQFKFEAEMAAWLFTSMDREQDGWKHELAGLPPVHKRMETQGWSVLKPLEADFRRYGLTHALREFERLAQHWEDYNAYMRQTESRSSGDPLAQPDLFFSAPRGVGAENRLEDPLNFLFSDSFRLSGVERTGEFGAGLVFLLKALSFIPKHDWPFHAIDSLDRILDGADSEPIEESVGT